MGEDDGPVKEDPEIARLRGELDRFKKENSKLVKQYNDYRIAATRELSSLKDEVRRANRDLVEATKDDAVSNLMQTVRDLGG